MKNNKLRNALWEIIFTFLVIGLAACSHVTPQATVEMMESPISTEAINEEVSETLIVETSAPQQAVILTTSPESNQSIVSSISSALEALAQTSGLLFETVENLTPEGITTNVKVVVVVGPNLDVVGWASDSPNTQFVVINIPGIVPGNNISVIGNPVQDEKRIAFMAGYLAALISDDYKVSALIPSNIDNSEGMVESFVVGARFFCGICQPKYPPYNQFPQWEILPVENGSSGFEGIVDLLASSGTEILYLQKELLSTEMLDYLSGYGLKVISDGVPSVPYDYWVGRLDTDPVNGLSTIWADVIAGMGGFQVPSAIHLMDTDAGFVSEGRYWIFEEMLADLENGIISIEPMP